MVCGGRWRFDRLKHTLRFGGHGVLLGRDLNPAIPGHYEHGMAVPAIAGRPVNCHAAFGTSPLTSANGPFWHCFLLWLWVIDLKYKVFSKIFKWDLGDKKALFFRSGFLGGLRSFLFTPRLGFDTLSADFDALAFCGMEPLEIGLEASQGSLHRVRPALGFLVALAANRADFICSIHNIVEKSLSVTFLILPRNLVFVKSAREC